MCENYLFTVEMCAVDIQSIEIINQYNSHMKNYLQKSYTHLKPTHFQVDDSIAPYKIGPTFFVLNI